MKKLALIAGLFGALTFTACENGTHYCWEVQVEYSYKYDNNSKIEKESEIDYRWNTKDGIEVEIDNLKETLKENGCYDIKITKKKASKNQDDCHKH